MEIIDFHITEIEGVTYYTVCIDESNSFRGLSFSHEIGLCFILEDDEAKIDGGWEFNSGGDWNWYKGEENLFEEMHPGYLKELAEFVIEHGCEVEQNEIQI